jgi:hypothetical protein
VNLQILIVGLALLALGGPARAQPVPEAGYTVTDKELLTVEHTSTSAWTAERMARLYARAKEEVEDRLGIPLPPRPHAIVAASDAEFARRYRLRAGHRPGDSVLAVAFPSERLIIVRQSGIREGTSAGLYQTFKHELAHLALGPLEVRRGERLPRWLNEGLAEVAAGRRTTGEEEASLSGWARFGSMPELASLAHRFPEHGQAGSRAYLVSFSFVHWVDRRAGADRLVQELQTGALIDEAFRRTLGMSVHEAELEWRLDLIEEHSFLKTILHSVTVWTVTALLALVAFARHIWKTRQLKRQLFEEELTEDRGGPEGKPEG